MAIRRGLYEPEPMPETGMFNINWKVIAKVLKWGVFIIGPIFLVWWLIRKKFPGWIAAIAGIPGGIGTTLKGYGENAWDVIKYSLTAGRAVTPEEVKEINADLAASEQAFKEEAAQKKQIEAEMKSGGIIKAQPNLLDQWVKDVNLLQDETTDYGSGKVMISVPFKDNIYTMVLPKETCLKIWGTATDNRKIAGSIMVYIYNRRLPEFEKLSDLDIAKKIKNWEFIWTGHEDYWKPRFANYMLGFKATEPPKPQTDQQFDMFKIVEED